MLYSDGQIITDPLGDQFYVLVILTIFLESYWDKSYLEHGQNSQNSRLVTQGVCNNLSTTVDDIFKDKLYFSRLPNKQKV